jgi:hypothetical protein
MTIKINLDNAAFDQGTGYPGLELGRILHRLANVAEDFGEPGALTMDRFAPRDCNGNVVGSITVEG